MEHNQSHSRESIKITHNRVKRSRLFLNAFMRTLRRANAISAPGKARRENFANGGQKNTRERRRRISNATMMSKERERENAERNKKEKEGETLGVLSLFFFFLPVVSFFANTRDDREQSRTFYVSPQLLLFWCYMVCCCRRRRRLSRGTREKSYDEELFLFEFFQFFLSLSILAISLRGSVARIQSKKNTNNNRLL